MKFLRTLAAALAVGLLVPGAFAQQTTIRLGHFPNITHAQALVASQLSRQGKGWFEERLGPGVKLEYYVYNAGPSAMEAIFAGSIDLTYVGPNPVLNAYSKSQGGEIRVVAGAANGGAALVVQGDGRLSKPEDFRGRKVATPQLGNTQDVACRAWLKKHGYRITQLGGDVSVLPTANPDQLSLFQSGQIDAVWTVEPWVTRLELEAKGKIFLEQKEALTTLLASSVKFQKNNGALLKKFVAAHVELTKWINEHPAEAKELLRAELKELTKREFPAQTADAAWPRLHFTSEISRAPFDALVTEAQSVGFLKDIPDLGKLVAVP
ncbi:MAG: sulfonate transport system substrate-binding protein [Chthoniobacter sp.]|jgi:NitT/TauT family transport system substrate-binding protein|nr:sulfonate transport system substrate-binding protein [Chthoniobacter sp.]